MTNPCFRCQTGVDHDDDGNCGFCARLTDLQALQYIKIRFLFQQGWIERAKQYLGAAYDNDAIFISEGPEFLKGPQ